MPSTKNIAEPVTLSGKSNCTSRLNSTENLIVTLTKKSKRLHFNKYFEENKKNPKKTWNGIKKIINSSQKDSNTPNSLKEEQKIITDKKEIASHFNKFFTSIAAKIESKIFHTNNTHRHYLVRPVTKSFFINPTTPDEVESIIKLLDNNKAIGPNSIPTKILKLVKSKLSTPLSDIINKSFELGIFPDLLKLAKVIPIYKKGDKLSVNNYRPISILSNISKIFEKLMHRRLYSFLNQQKILYELQFGFRLDSNTTQALIKITELIRDAIDDSMFACGIFLDFQKAFDTVKHEILLDKLEHYGIRGIGLSWFKSFLSSRSQFVSVNGTVSENLSITHGVPQGSVLGPLLFLIFINDLNLSIQHSKTHHFADDTNLILIDKSLKKINKFANHDLKLASEWVRANRLSLNADKTEIVIFRAKNKIITKKLNFRINGKKIELSGRVKYLGIHIDQHLKWDYHINNIRKKIKTS